MRIRWTKHTIKHYETIADLVAKRTRLLIPRSGNRALDAKGYTYWRKKDVPMYLYAQMKIMRGGTNKSVKKLLDEANHDLLKVLPAEEKIINEEFMKKMKKIGIKNWQDINKKINHKSFASKLKALFSKKAPGKERWEQVCCAVRYRIGNCGECSWTAYHMLLDVPVTMKENVKNPWMINTCYDDSVYVSRVHLESEKINNKRTGRGDHAFVLIHKDKNIINWKKPQRDWLDSDDIIVCDPWFIDNGGACIASKMPMGQEVIAMSKKDMVRRRAGDREKLRKFVDKMRKNQMAALREALYNDYDLLRLDAQGHLGQGIPENMRTALRNLNFFTAPVRHLAKNFSAACRF